MARRCTNKGEVGGGEQGNREKGPRLAPVVRHSQQSVPTSLIGINRQQEQAARMAPVEISSRHTLLRRTTVVRDLRMEREGGEGEGFWSGQAPLRSRLLLGVLNFRQFQTSHIFYIPISFRPLWYQWHIWCNRISMSLERYFPCASVKYGKPRDASSY